MFWRLAVGAEPAIINASVCGFYMEIPDEKGIFTIYSSPDYSGKKTQQGQAGILIKRKSFFGSDAFFICNPFCNFQECWITYIFFRIYHMLFGWCKISNFFFGCGNIMIIYSFLMTARKKNKKGVPDGHLFY